MVASSIKRSVVKATRPARTRTGNFHFEDDIGLRPGVIIRPDTQFINSIGYTLFMSYYYFSALQYIIYICINTNVYKYYKHRRKHFSRFFRNFRTKRLDVCCCLSKEPLTPVLTWLSFILLKLNCCKNRAKLPNQSRVEMLLNVGQVKMIHQRPDANIIHFS